jgi:(2Fe-2S) ferredoxin
VADRKLVIDGETWLYRVGESSVKIRNPEGLGHAVDVHTLTGRDVERGRWKRTSDGMVTPGDVRKYIDEHLKKGVP